MTEGHEFGTARAAKPLTPAYLERAAVFYLARHASSAANLARVLARKAQRRAGPDSMPPDVSGWIDDVVAKAVRSGLVDDRSYAGTKLNGLMRKGASSRTARLKLAAKGVPAPIVAEALAEAAPDELAQARRWAERKRLGPWRRVPDPNARERDLAALCRAGFPYRVATAALSWEHDGGQSDPDPFVGRI